MKLAAYFFYVLALVTGVARGAYGDATWYHAGQGACGAHSNDVDRIVALSSKEFANGSYCWKHILVHYQGRTIDATVADVCPGCSQWSIDLSPGAFQGLASLNTGRIQVRWDFV